jgi:hypothetical protein
MAAKGRRTGRRRRRRYRGCVDEQKDKTPNSLTLFCSVLLTREAGTEAFLAGSFLACGGNIGGSNLTRVVKQKKGAREDRTFEREVSRFHVRSVEEWKRWLCGRPAIESERQREQGLAAVAAVAASGSRRKGLVGLGRSRVWRVALAALAGAR